MLSLQFFVLFCVAMIVRIASGEEKKYQVLLDDLVNRGDISANVDMFPGDVLIIPEAWF